MKTQNELQKMTDQQLTFELACLVFGADEVYMAKHGKVGTTRDDIASASGYVDLNDWNWIMPLAVDHKLDIAPANADKWYCAHWYTDDHAYEAVDDSPQRAIAICLVLKMQEDAE